MSKALSEVGSAALMFVSNAGIPGRRRCGSIEGRVKKWLAGAAAEWL